MDAVQQFVQQLGLTVPKTFVIGGASKVKPAHTSTSRRIRLSPLAWMGEYAAVRAFGLSYASFLPAAWTTAAVDNERVIGAMPIVMDMLNLQKVETSLQLI